ncbi:MAG: hypothetical protein ACYTEO_19595 [Planctomycetota bacterium]
MSDTNLAVIEINPIVTTDDVVNQVQTIQELMKRVMQEGQHYGKIPGCGDKPTLLLPGAQKIALLFGFSPEYEVDRYEIPGGHREYEVTCRLLHRQTGNLIGEGVGNGSTQEGKYKYRSENTGDEVPKEYWEHRDPSLIGGPAYSVRKQKEKWYIFHRVEHDNPADYHNTVKKMAKKRAYVDAVLTATAASDIFTQDIEDMGEVLGGENGKAGKPAKLKPDKPKPAAKTKRTPPNKEPPKKDAAPQEKPKGDNDGIYMIADVFVAKEKPGEWKLYQIDTAEGDSFKTFSDSDSAIAEDALKGNRPVEITYAITKYGKDLKTINIAEGQELQEFFGEEQNDEVK